MSRRILAIEIGNHNLSAVLLTTGIKSMTVEAGAVLALDRTNDQPGHQDPLEQALSTLQTKINTANATVVVALPAGRSLYRTIEVPFKDEKKIRQILSFELEPLLPLPIDRLVFDFQHNQQEEGVEVLAAGIDRQYLDYVREVFAGSGLHPQLIVPGGFAMATVFSIHGPQQSEQFIVLDVGLDTATMFALSQGQTLLVRSMQVDTSAEEMITALAIKIRQTLTSHNDIASSPYSPTALFITGSGIAV